MKNEYSRIKYRKSRFGTGWKILKATGLHLTTKKWIKQNKKGTLKST